MMRYSFNTALPFLPIELINKNKAIKAEALLDSGSTVNVLPYSLGLTLGFDWNLAKSANHLTGSLSGITIRGVICHCSINGFLPIRLAFAWADTNNVRLILGQQNFFALFDICFSKTDTFFELTAR